VVPSGGGRLLRNPYKRLGRGEGCGIFRGELKKLEETRGRLHDHAARSSVDRRSGSEGNTGVSRDRDTQPFSADRRVFKRVKPRLKLGVRKDGHCIWTPAGDGDLAEVSAVHINNPPAERFGPAQFLGLYNN